MHTMLAGARRGHPGLYWLAAGMAVLALVTAGLAVVDPRTLVGAPLWFKPLKFSISIALYAFALAWMLGQLRERTMRRTGWAIVAGLALEMVIIVGQAARGLRSPTTTTTAGSAPCSSTSWVPPSPWSGSSRSPSPCGSCASPARTGR
jgi:hypothetical protein